MLLRQLECFSVICEELSFTRAAERLGMTRLDMYDGHNLKVIPIENPTLRREIGIIYRKDNYMGAAARGFMVYQRFEREQSR